jgi:1,4-alpha-glucan branching enzyme
MGILRKRKRMSGSMEKETKKPGKRWVEFSFHFPEAKEVFLAGDFNSWDFRSFHLEKDGNGDWEAKLNLLPGRYEYKLLVDGSWVQDFECAEMVPNPFGTNNCVLRVE